MPDALKPTLQFHGTCLCGSVSYTVTREPVQVVACHCKLCRSMTGGPYAVYVVARTRDVQFEDTRTDLKQHQVTERTSRVFCSQCGTPLFNSNPITYPGLTMLYLGSTEEPQRYTPSMHIFCENKLPWVALAEGSKEFARAPGEA